MRPGHLSPSHSQAAAQRVVTAARRDFFAHGFRRVTMDDLAHELGMSKKTLYACFPSKSELLKAVLLDKFREIDADLQRVTSKSSDISAALHELLATVQRHTGEIQPPFVRDIQREAPDLFAMVEGRRRLVIQRHFGAFFNRARKAGMLRTDISPEVITEMLLGSVQAILNPMKMTELGLTPKAGFSAIISVILEGVITKPGKVRR